SSALAVRLRLLVSRKGGRAAGCEVVSRRREREEAVGRGHEDERAVRHHHVAPPLEIETSARLIELKAAHSRQAAQRPLHGDRRPTGVAPDNRETAAGLMTERINL